MKRVQSGWIYLLTCRAAVRLAAKEMDGPLSPAERLALPVHTALCGCCRRYRRHLRTVRACLRALPGTDAPMPDEVRQRLQRAVTKEISARV